MMAKSLQVLRRAVHRTREDSWRSGWTCLKTHALNFLWRVRARLDRSERVECPCCGWKGHRFRFLDCGRFIVPDAVCPHCLGHERHRMLHLFLTRMPPAFMQSASCAPVLHFAPEPQVRQFTVKNPYLKVFGTDLDPKVLPPAFAPVFAADIQRLPLADEIIHGIFCLHVLEHIPSDDLAIREMARVLHPDGQAVIMVPFMMDQTATIEYDAPDPFMFDHVRGYSPLDFKERLTHFSFVEYKPLSFLNKDEVCRYQVPESQVIYVCTKRRIASC